MLDRIRLAFELTTNIVSSNGHGHYALYIGDETRDIEAARNNDLISIAVTWGYNTEQVLQDYSPTYVVHEPNDLLSISPKS